GRSPGLLLRRDLERLTGLLETHLELAAPQSRLDELLRDLVETLGALAQPRGQLRAERARVGALLDGLEGEPCFPCALFALTLFATQLVFSVGQLRERFWRSEDLLQGLLLFRG